MGYDTRTYMTRKAMSESLKNLMQQKSLDTITVRDITNASGFHRQTFYYHFKDIYDLFDWTFENEIEAISLGIYHEGITWEGIFSGIIEYLRANEYICRCIVNGMGREQLVTHLYKKINVVLKRLIGKLHENEEIEEKYLDFSAKFYTYAVGNYIFEWIKGGMKESTEEIIDLFDFVIRTDHR